MKDIHSLENRIKNLEYYTSLSLLETDTSNLFIRDVNGLNRFKSGFFVDDFSTTSSQKKVTIVKNSIDISNSELRPSPYTTEVDLILGSNSLIGLGVTANPQADARFVTDLIGTNVKKTGELITLDYVEVEEINQPYATRVESVAPYRVGYYGGTINLSPSSDVWVDTVRLVANRTDIATNYIQSESQINASDLDNQSGFGPVTWGSWETIWTGSTKAADTRTVNVGYYIVKEDLETVTKTGTTTRTGKRSITKDEFSNVSLGDTVLSSDISSYMRSRNIEFTAKRLKPFTKVYSFFSGVDVNKYIIPKLLEITMQSGTFQVGENVVGTIIASATSGLGVIQSDPKITFRVANSNHKYGPYNSPIEVFTANPYNSSQLIPSDYSSTSSILNIDTYSLSQQPQGQFSGFIQSGMILRGQTSGAEAVISDVRLITDTIGVIIGSFFVPNPNVFGNPNFQTGTKLFRITSSPTNSLIDSTITSAEERFYSEGKINRVQENILSVRTVRTETQTVTESKFETSTGPTAVVSTTIVGNTLPPYVPPAPAALPQVSETGFTPEETPPISYPPIEQTPPNTNYTSPPPVTDGDGGFVAPTPVTPVTPVTPGSTTTTTAKKPKVGVEFLNVNQLGLAGAKFGGDIGKLAGAKPQFSVPLQTVNGKTYGELVDKNGKSYASKIFKEAGIKVTQTDKDYAKVSTKLKETKQPKAVIPTKNSSSSGSLYGIASNVGKQLSTDKLVSNAKITGPKGLVTIVPNAITNVPANKGKDNKDKDRGNNRNNNNNNNRRR